MSISQTHGYHIAFEIDGDIAGHIIDDLIPGYHHFTIGAFTGRVEPIENCPSRVKINSDNALTISSKRKIFIAGNSFILRTEFRTLIGINTSGKINFRYTSAPELIPDTISDLKTFQNLINVANAIGGTCCTVNEVLQNGSKQLLHDLKTSLSLPQVPIEARFGPGQVGLSLNRIDLHTISGSLFILLQFQGADLSLSPTNQTAFTSSIRGSKNSAMILDPEALITVSSFILSNHPSSPVRGALLQKTGTIISLESPMRISLNGINVTLSALNICISGNGIMLSVSISETRKWWHSRCNVILPLKFELQKEGKLTPEFNPESEVIKTGFRFSKVAYFSGSAVALLAGIFQGLVAGIAFIFAFFLIDRISFILSKKKSKSVIAILKRSISSVLTTSSEGGPARLLEISGYMKLKEIIIDDFSMSKMGYPYAEPIVRLNKISETHTNLIATDRGGTALDEYIDYHVANRVVYAANHQFLKTPVNVTWKLNNTEITGSGYLNMNGKNVRFTIDDKTCTLDSCPGDDISGVLNVKITGSDDVSKSSTIIIDVSGTHRDYPNKDTSFQMIRKLYEQVSGIKDEMIVQIHQKV